MFRRLQFRELPTQRDRLIASYFAIASAKYRL